MANKLCDVVQQYPVAWMDSDCKIELNYKDWMGADWAPLYRN